MIPGDEIRLGDQYYIRASGVAADLPKLVLKHEDAFLVADRRGDLLGMSESEFGFYCDDTRYLRQLELLVNGQRPLLLSAAASDERRQIAVDLTNADIRHADEAVHPGRTVHLGRRLTLDRNLFVQEVAVEVFAADVQQVILTWRFAADFVDVFEVRGFTRARGGELLPPVVGPDTVELAYRGLDGIVRRAWLTFNPQPDHLDGTAAWHHLALGSGQRVTLTAAVSAAAAPARLPSVADVTARRETQPAPNGLRRVEIRTSAERVDRWIERARVDLEMLVTNTPDGPMPYAGIPWYVAPFGRDSLITAHQLLPFAPELARGTLRSLARWQARQDDAFTDQEPGKILHEYRRGELAACREIVFVPYYGSVDATPLFVMLLGEYVRWTGDLPLARALWPNVLAALGWMRQGHSGRRPSFLSYLCRSPRGLANQGWKDSVDAIMHDSGALASPPIALVEAQGYRFAALQAAAELGQALDDRGAAAGFRDEARRLAAAFESAFWLDDEQFYALALDGGGAPCRVITSNPAHCLWTGLIDPERAKALSSRLLDPDMFSGWGLRTLSRRERRFNPMSYHNGSVWPHDTAIAAAGFRRYGLTDQFLTVATALVEAALHWEGLRMPELFCGFHRVPGFGPTRYPAACSPQAWSSGVVFSLIANFLGLMPSAAENRLTLKEPTLPDWLDWLEIRGLAVRHSRIDLRLTRGRQGASVEILERHGDAEIVVRR